MNEYFTNMLALIAAAVVLTACPSGKEDTPAKKEEIKTNLVLKSAFSKISSDAKIVSVTAGDGIRTASFSDGSSIAFDEFNHGFLSVGTDDYIYMNGHRSEHRFVDIPYWTVGADGMWYTDGEATAVRATPANYDAAPGDIYLTNVQDGVRSVEFRFSDGSILSYPVLTEHKIFVRKAASKMEILVGVEGDSRYILYPFNKRYRAYSEGAYPSFLDNWGIGALELHSRSGDSFSKTASLFLNGEAEMAVNIPRADDPSTYTYVGGSLHGFEQIDSENGKRCISILVDGEPVAESAVFSLKEVSTVEMYQKSTLYQAYSNSEPWAKAERRWTFKDGDLHIHIKLTLLKDMDIKQAQFGMMCVLRRWEGNSSYNYLTRYAVKDNLPFKVFDTSDGWQNGSPLTQSDHATNRISQYGERGLSFALVVDESTRKDKGGMFCGTNGNAYNKIYYDLTGRYDAKEAEVLESKVHWEIDRIR